MIFFDESTVKINGVILPGTFRSIEVKTSALVEEVEVKGKKEKPKQATGYEDGKVTLELTLLESEEQTIIDKLDIIQKLFKNSGQAKPNVYEIVNEHTAVRGISKVIFKDMTTKETNKKSEIIAVLEFWEYITVTVTAKKKTSSSSAKKASTSTYNNYLPNRGVAPKLVKTAPSPISNMAGHMDFLTKIQNIKW